MSNSNSRTGGGQFRTECCQEEKCNGGPFPILQDPVPGNKKARVLYFKKSILCNLEKEKRHTSQPNLIACCRWERNELVEGHAGRSDTDPGPGSGRLWDIPVL